MKLSRRTITAFRKKIYCHYAAHKRDLPWRSTCDPYRIVVSEIMLQQTQVDRVIPKYRHFICAFPDFSALAAAPLNTVLSFWHGLGYNRRALSLKKLAHQVVDLHNGMLPDSLEGLLALPGIGIATASSISAFAFNKPVVFIETNIRTVFIHEFFGTMKNVDDKEVAALAEQVLDKKNPCKWYNALMDYGVMLKRNYPNPSRKSAQYAKQSRFEGSHRQVRGMVLKTLLKEKSLTQKQLIACIDKEESSILSALDDLIRDRLVSSKKGEISIA
ncbi:MAG: A/G-specific adenine glycosylase [Chitinivibrionales bacterium]|nr:A/G-specific adenine glycosylase [Chitinivibrionales bacterium]